MGYDSFSGFITPVDFRVVSQDNTYSKEQLGWHVENVNKQIVGEAGFDNVDLVIVGCADMRGMGISKPNFDGLLAIRHAFYSLFHWHKAINVADLGDIVIGRTLLDTYAALKIVLLELYAMNKRVVILGGSHDLTLSQYQVFCDQELFVEATMIDALLDLKIESIRPSDNFLLQMLTNEPNYFKHFNHIGFQSYFIPPRMLETIDKLRFDCIRLGRAKEFLLEMEPYIRGSYFVTVDINCIAHSFAPANRLSPNGFFGEEICKLMQFAGMGQCSSIGIYGYVHSNDTHDITAIQVAQMLWYILDGLNTSKNESPVSDRTGYEEFFLTFSDLDTTFLQSKKTGRWWLMLPDKKFIPCSKQDYLMACHNQIPERWMRAIERQ